MNSARRQFVIGVCVLLLAIGCGIGWQQHSSLHYLDGDTASFIATFDPPPGPRSPDTRQELDLLLQLQRTRTDAQVAAARADRKTEVSRFYATIGLGSQLSLPLVSQLAQRVEDDIRPYVRAAKKHFRRLRPAEIEPRLSPCIGNVQEDLSYPSGHATYGYAMANMLADLVPEWRVSLESRADEFALQRMICGVHFRSDIQAGRRGAQWLIEQLHASARYRADAAAAAAELRAALPANQGKGHSSASRAPPSVALEPAVTRPR